MFIVTWLFDKFGYIPKVSVDTTWPFPATQKNYMPHPDEINPTKKTVKKTVKIAKATTRPKNIKK
jgi:hypothetical protein